MSWMSSTSLTNKNLLRSRYINSYKLNMEIMSAFLCSKIAAVTFSCCLWIFYEYLFCFFGFLTACYIVLMDVFPIFEWSLLLDPPFFELMWCFNCIFDCHPFFVQYFKSLCHYGCRSFFIVGMTHSRQLAICLKLMHS